MHDQQNPLVSIIIPTYNRAGLIKDTLHSVESQTYANWECIIVDDGSTDNTSEVVKKFIDRDKRFKLLFNKRKKGAQGARNTGLLEAMGKYISFFDSDNLMQPERFSKQIRYLENNSLCDVCTCYSHLLDDKNEIWGTHEWNSAGNILKDLLIGSTYVDYNSSVIRKTVIDKIGFLDEDCPSYQEWDTHIRLGGFARYGTVPEFLVSYCTRSTGRISTDLRRELHGLTYIYAKHKQLWIDNAGKDVFLLNIYSLSLRILREYKIANKEMFQEEMSLLLPELMRVPFRIKLKALIGRLWFLFKMPFIILWQFLKWLILCLMGRKKFSFSKIKRLISARSQVFLDILFEIKHVITLLLGINSKGSSKSK
jgi:glycosyltransferase involved in cell wall biosynthesis